MHRLDLTLTTPAENLALEEVLLDEAESGRGGEVLRFWESPTPFVVLGVSQVLADHVNEEGCRAAGVPVLRRCSAGGCVLQGPGSLNFTLILRRDRHPDLANIRSSYCYILCRVREALAALGIEVRHEGISDVAMQGRKVSGNAQKRRRHYLLHHGTLLYRFDPDLMARCLREPADQPAYRGDRSHRDFLTALPAGQSDLIEALTTRFEVQERRGPLLPGEEQAVARLVETKYGDADWTHRR